MAATRMSAFDPKRKLLHTSRRRGIFLIVAERGCATLAAQAAAKMGCSLGVFHNPKSFAIIAVRQGSTPSSLERHPNGVQDQGQRR
jgi:hypothetical protein